MQVYNSTFRTSHSATAEWQEFNFVAEEVDGAVVSGNTFVNTDSTTSFGASQNLVVERNETYSAEGPGPSGGFGFALGRPFAVYYPRSQTARNLYLGYNYFHDIGWLDQGVIQTDGGASAYFGGIDSSSANSITLAHDPSWVATSDNPQSLALEIVSGKGAGQFSMLEGIDGRTVGLITPLKVIPDNSSLIQITDPKINQIYSHNVIKDAAGIQIQIFGAAVDSVIEDNDIEDGGRGMQIWGFGPYGGYLSDFNVDILRNHFTIGNGHWIVDSGFSYQTGLSIGDSDGCFIFGLSIRDNQIPSDQTIQPTNGGNGIAEIMIEQNDANVEYTWLYPGYIVQDNLTPQ